MNRNFPRLVRLSFVTTFAFATLATMGCTDNRLPPVPVPKAEMNAKVPKWYPEKEWTAKEGQSQIFIQGKIVFETGSATINKFGESEKVLKELLKFATEHPEVTRIRIEGHTDDRGDDQKNEELSAQRALAVCNWLVDNGVDYARLIAVGFGESRPLGPNELAEGRDDNRRVEVHVAEVRGRPFLGKDPYNGGIALVVKSKEERDKEKEAERLARLPPPKPPPYKKTGDVIVDVNVTELQAKLQKKQEQDGGSLSSAPPKK